MSLEQDDQPKNECDAASSNHEEKLPRDTTLPTRLRVDFGRVISGTPELFYKRLKHTFARIGIDFDVLDYRTTPTDPPPCFELNGTNYPEWLRMASIEPVPVRHDMPAEPNYCFDCTTSFRKRAIGAGACLFPNTKFEVRKADGDKEEVGISRSGEMPPDGYVSYQELTVPVEALADQLRRYVRNHKTKTLARVPKRLRGQFEKLTATRTEGSRES